MYYFVWGMGVGMGKSKIDARWRITIPKSARGNFKPGDEVLVEEINGKIIISKINEDALKMFREIKLYIKEDKLIFIDAERGKHKIGALKI